jgi:hypothetical protein
MVRVLPLLVAMLPAVWCRLLLIETREENTTTQNGGAPPPGAPALPRKRGYSEQLSGGGGGNQPPSVSGDDIASYVPFSDYGTIFRDDIKVFFRGGPSFPKLDAIFKLFPAIFNRFLADDVRLMRLHSC